MDSLLILFVLLAIAAIFVLRGNAEGWRPFAWYGAPPGTYQAGGDWAGVVPATRMIAEIVPAVGKQKRKSKKK